MVYAHIMLNALTQSKCSKLCWPNMLEPSTQIAEEMIALVTFKI